MRQSRTFAALYETRITPAVAAGVELKRWNLEDVVEMTAAYIRRKEDAKFEAPFGSVLI